MGRTARTIDTADMQRRLARSRERIRAQSDTIAVVAVVAVVLVLGAVIGLFLLGELSEPGEEPSIASIDIDATDEAIVVSHAGGDTLAPEDLTLLVEAEHRQRSYTFTNTSLDGPFGAGDELVADLQFRSANITATVVYDPTNAVLADEEFTVDDRARPVFELSTVSFDLDTETDTLTVDYAVDNTGTAPDTQQVELLVDDDRVATNETTLGPTNGTTGTLTHGTSNTDGFEVELRTQNDSVTDTVEPTDVTIAFATFGEVAIYDRDTGNPVTVLSAAGSFVSSVTATPDGEYVAYGSGDASVYVHNTTDWGLDTTLTGATDDVTDVTVSPDGDRLAAVSNDSRLAIYDTTDWSEVATVSTGDRPQSAAFSPDGDQLAVGTADGEIRVHDTDDWEVTASLSAPANEVTDVVFSPDGDQLVGTELAGALYVYDTETWDQTVAVTQAGGLGATYAPDGDRLVSAAGNLGQTAGSLPVYDTTAWSREVELADDTPTSTAWSDDGDWVAGGFVDGSVDIYATDDWSIATEIDDSGPIRGLTFLSAD